MKLERSMLLAVAVLVLVSGVAIAVLLPMTFRSPTEWADCARNPAPCDTRIPLRIMIAVVGVLVAAVIATLARRLPADATSMSRASTVVRVLAALALLLVVGGLLGGTLTETVLRNGMDPIIEQSQSAAGLISMSSGLAAGAALWFVSERLGRRTAVLS